MKRLRDLEPSTPLQRKAQQLVSSVEPISDSPERMARIRRRLDEPRGALAAFRRLPALAIAALIALFGASAFAAVRVFVEARRVDDTVDAPSAREPKAPPTVQEPTVEAPAVEEQPALEGEQPAEARDARPERATRRRSKAHVAAPSPEHEAHDSELVHRAVKALRVDGNAALAARLLEQDRIRNPDGPLAEEALSLQIEAALELSNGRAGAFAKQYLTRYPNGRYQSIAQRALREGQGP